MGRLQGIQNKALRFAYGIRYSPDTQPPTAESLHNGRYPMFPINQNLYWQAKKLWNKIETGQAGNQEMYRTLNNLTEDIGYNNPYKCFQSSLNAIAGPVPEPMYTKRNNQRRRVINDNLARIRRVIYTHYLHDDEDSDSESELDTDEDTDTDDEN